jgi:ABC-type sugar transport system substrate-binding protein
VIKGLDNPFFQAMQQGIEEQASAQGTEVTVQAANSITDTTGQADKLNALAGQDFSCYLVNPISGTNLV